MLRAVFKEIGKYSTGNPKYELDRYEFHVVKNNPTLRPVNKEYAQFKKSSGMLAEIKKTVQYHLNRMSGKKSHFKDEDINSLLNIKGS